MTGACAVQMSAKTIESLWFVEQVDEEDDDDEGCDAVSSPLWSCRYGASTWIRC